MQPLIKKIEALVISISVQSGIGIIEAISEKDGVQPLFRPLIRHSLLN